MRRCLFGQERNPKIDCTYIRVRDEGNKITMSAKQHPSENETAIESQKEYEITVSDFETAKQVLLSAGLKQTSFQENKRETWQMPDGTLVELETWPQLPNYLEIEGKSSEAVQKTANQLGFDWNERIIQPNRYLYAKQWGISQEAVLERIAHLTFDE